MRSSARVVILLSAVAAMAGCTSGAPDYTGTWTHGDHLATSTLALFPSADGYVVRWDYSATREEGQWEVDCGWDGTCTGTLNGEPAARYRFESWIDDDSGHLMIECRGAMTLPEEAEIHYIDELIVESDGAELWSYTLEESGEVYDVVTRPRRILTLASATVTDPPATAP